MPTFPKRNDTTFEKQNDRNSLTGSHQNISPHFSPVLYCFHRRCKAHLMGWLCPRTIYFFVTIGTPVKLKFRNMFSLKFYRSMWFALYVFDIFSSEFYHILAIKMLHMLIVIVFWGREVRRLGSYLGGSPWKWLNMSTRATNMASVAAMAKSIFWLPSLWDHWISRM